MDDMVNEKVGIALFYCPICFKIKTPHPKLLLKTKTPYPKFFGENAF